jgi:predicted acetyltransferase
MLALVEPAMRLRSSWLDAHHEWGPGQHEDGFGIHPTDDVESAAGFTEWLARLASEADRCTYWWIVERDTAPGDTVLGGIALRYGPVAGAHPGGHIGYGVRPSARRRGVAGWALGRILVDARERGLDHVLVVCAADNLASAKTIERAGGVLDDTSESEARGEAAPLRYRIRVSS